MPTGCADPRCPVNKRRSHVKKSPRNFCKIHGKPSGVTFVSDDVRGNNRERKRLKCLSRSSNADVKEPRRDRSNCCRKCCKNKKCKAYKNTAERPTSTDPRIRRRIANDNATRSHALRKSGMLFDRHKDKERPCECVYRRSCTRGTESGSEIDPSCRKGIRRYRSRNRRKGKCSWLINCCGRFCICAKNPGNSMESDAYVKSRAASLRNCECCSRSCNDKHNLRKRDGTGSRKKDKKSVGKCRCADPTARYRTLPEDQSYMQNVCSKGLNAIRKAIDFRL